MKRHLRTFVQVMKHDTSQCIDDCDMTTCCVLIVRSSADLVCCCQIVNHHLLKDLTELGLWNSDMKNQLIASNGSIQVLALLCCYVRLLLLFVQTDAAIITEVSKTTVSRRTCKKNKFAVFRKHSTWQLFQFSYWENVLHLSGWVESRSVASK